jgi:hypothetical protein
MSEKQLNLRLSGSMFKRRGAWLAMFQSGTVFGDTSLYIGTCHLIKARERDSNKIVDVFPTFEGRKVPFEVKAAPAELTVSTKHGNIRFTFANEAMMLAEGDKGMGLLMTRNPQGHEAVYQRRDAWVGDFKRASTVVFKGLNGSGFTFNNGSDEWNWEKLSARKAEGSTIPGPDGKFTLVMEEFTWSNIVRDTYPTYSEALTSMQNDWDSFIKAMPSFKEPFEQQRAECEYTLWSYLMNPYRNMRYPAIQMFAGIMGSQWQLCQNAVALQEHIDIAIDLLLNPIDLASPLGQLPDMYDDHAFDAELVKPPVHGWAIIEIMKNHDLLKECPRDKLEKLYQGTAAWGEWFMKYRDDDNDGLPSIFHPDETGLDDSSMFVDHVVLTAPDTSAYLVLLFEAVGDLAKILGKAEEAETWYDKSGALLKKLIEVLWDGEHFVAMVPETGEKVFKGSIVHYIPAILGNRLPPEIIDKIADDLSDTEKFLCPYGLASEDMTSDEYYPSTIGRGAIVPPAMIFICTGLWETKRKAAAKVFAENYCNALRKSNFPFLINPKEGTGSYFGITWSRCAYTILARMLSED